MTYEYNDKSRQLDFPNPFRIENWFLMAACLILIAAGVALLLLGRSALGSGHQRQTALPLLLGIGVLLAGLNQGRQLLLQLRFLFGRNLPLGLAPELQADAEASSDEADDLKETLRQNALTYPEPQGPLNGLLYAWIRELIFAPLPVQLIAQRQFQTAAAILVTLISFLVAWLGFADGESAQWLGLFYFGFSVILLLRPLESGAAARAQVSMRNLIGLIVAAIFIPVLLPLIAPRLPSLAGVALNSHTLFLLLAALSSVGLYFMALMRQMSGIPPINMAREQTSLSMNCHPKQLLDELDRTLQDSWVEQIPNRRYARLLPIIGDGTGIFSAELLEETQPMSGHAATGIRFGTAFATPRFRLIAWLDVLGLGLTALGVGWMLSFALKFQPSLPDAPVLSWLTLGLSMLVVANYCFRAGHVLWGRFDFISRLVWVEMKGTYQAAIINVGNTLTDRVQTEKRLINIETMTLRVWAAELDTVIFGKRHGRYVVGLRGLPDYAQQLSAHLVNFAHEQSAVVAPTAQSDIQKTAVLAAMNGIGSDQASSLAKQLAQMLRTTNHTTAATGQGYCPRCQAAISSSNRFCGTCGQALFDAD